MDRLTARIASYNHSQKYKVVEKMTNMERITKQARLLRSLGLQETDQLYDRIIEWIDLQELGQAKLTFNLLSDSEKVIFCRRPAVTKENIIFLTLQ